MLAVRDEDDLLAPLVLHQKIVSRVSLRTTRLQILRREFILERFQIELLEALQE